MIDLFLGGVASSIFFITILDTLLAFHRWLPGPAAKQDNRPTTEIGKALLQLLDREDIWEWSAKPNEVLQTSGKHFDEKYFLWLSSDCKGRIYQQLIGKPGSAEVISLPNDDYWLVARRIEALYEKKTREREAERQNALLVDLQKLSKPPVPELSKVYFDLVAQKDNPYILEARPRVEKNESAAPNVPADPASVAKSGGEWNPSPDCLNFVACKNLEDTSEDAVVDSARAVVGKTEYARGTWHNVCWLCFHFDTADQTRVAKERLQNAGFRFSI